MQFTRDRSHEYHRRWLNGRSATKRFEGERHLALLLREDDVRALLPMRTAIDLLEEAFRSQDAGSAHNHVRSHVEFSNGKLYFMAASLRRAGAAGIKAYAPTGSGMNFIVTLFDTDTGSLIAVIEADWLGRIRTGAASALATRYLARENATTATIIGTGGQAFTQAEGLCAVRKLETIKVYSRDAGRRRAFCEALRGNVDCTVTDMLTVHEAVAGSDIVSAITSSREPVFDGSSLSPGTHVNAAGGNVPDGRELDDTTFSRAARIVTDDVDQAKIECGDLIGAVSSGVLQWDSVQPLSALVSGHAPRTLAGKGDITVFESQGAALEDVAVAKYVYERACETGNGQRIEFGGSK